MFWFQFRLLGNFSLATLLDYTIPSPFYNILNKIQDSYWSMTSAYGQEGIESRTELQKANPKVGMVAQTFQIRSFVSFQGADLLLACFPTDC